MNNRMKLQHVARVTFPAVFADALPGHVVAALAVPRVAVARVGAAQPEPAHVTRDLEIWQCEEKYLGSTENICPPPRSAGPCIPRRRCRRRTRGDTWRRARSRSGWRSPGPRCRRGTACRSRYRASLDTRVSHVARVVTLIRISNGNENLKNVFFATCDTRDLVCTRISPTCAHTWPHSGTCSRTDTPHRTCLKIIF